MAAFGIDEQSGDRVRSADPSPHVFLDRRMIEQIVVSGMVTLLLGAYYSSALGLAVIIVVAFLMALNIELARKAAQRQAKGLSPDGGWRRMVAEVLGPMLLCFQGGMLWSLDRPELRLIAVAIFGLVLFQATRATRRNWVLRSGLMPFVTLGLLSFYDLASGQAVAAASAELALVALSAALWSWGGARRGMFNAFASTRWVPAAEAATDPQESTRFLATVGHELRTPLNGIIGMTEALLGGQLSRDQREKAEVIAESGRSLTALLNDLLDHSKMEAGRLEIHPVTESFHAGLRHVISLFAPVAEQKGITLRLERDAGVPDWLEHDAIRLRQCLSNLVSNAIKFTDEGSVTVGVRCLRGGDRVGAMTDIEVTVTDTGIGLNGAGPDVLFEPFVQSKAAVMKQSGGTGLGLSIARRLAQRMGGDITAADAETGGAEFTLRFRAPVAEAAVVETVPEARLSAADTPSGQGLRVLVVDDVKTNRIVAQLFLKPLGIEAIEASSGEEAASILGRDRVDAVLLDLRMPGMSGEDLVRLIRSGEAGDHDVPVIAATADDRVELIHLKAAGFDGLVLKPMDQRALQAAVMSVVAARLVAPRSGPGEDRRISA